MLGLPVVLLVMISKEEMKQYNVKQENVVTNEKAYGEIWEVERTTFEDVIDLQGEFVTYKMQIMHLDGGQIEEIYAKEGDEIKKGEQIAKSSTDTFTSKWNGRIKEINLKEQYIIIEDTDELLLECYVDETELPLIKNKMETEEGYKLTLKSKFNAYTEQGFKVRFAVEGDFSCGQSLTLKAYTGKIYEDVLVVYEDCVYEKNGASYVRVIDDNDNFVEELEIKTGREFQDYIIVSGIEEGTKCDGGYQEVDSDMAESETNYE